MQTCTANNHNGKLTARQVATGYAIPSDETHEPKKDLHNRQYSDWVQGHSNNGENKRHFTIFAFLPVAVQSSY